MAASSSSGDGDTPSVAAEVQIATVKDHIGENVMLSWRPDSHQNGDRDLEADVPAFPFPVYILDSAKALAQDPACAARVCTFLEIKTLNIHPAPRFDIHETTKPNALTCIEHQRKEVDWRNPNGIWPRLVSHWTDGSTGPDGYKGLVIVLDSSNLTADGLLLVDFDPLAYESAANRQSVWHLVGKGDIATVRAERLVAAESIRRRLREVWVRAGYSWTAADLGRRNVGGFTPALYPAVDPAAHEDAESDDSVSADLRLDGPEELAGHALSDGEDENADDTNVDEAPLIKDSFRNTDLWISPEPYSRRFRTETYDDATGHCTVGVWDSRLSAQRPPFSVALFCGPGVNYSAESLFGCLNKGLLTHEAWTLDVKRGYNTLSQAYEHHTLDSNKRDARRTRRRQKCIRMIVDRVNSARLPTELCDLVQELLMPAAVPDYAASRIRPYQQMFLYFAPPSPRDLPEGPLLIYSRPSPRQNARYADGSRWHPTWMSDLCDFGVINLRFWHRTADEIHIVSSLWQSQNNPRQVGNLPVITLRFTSPSLLRRSDIFITERSAWDTDTWISLSHDVEVPLTVHSSGLFSHDVVYEALELANLTTGEVLCQLPVKALGMRRTLSCSDSWSTSRSLGLPCERNLAEQDRRMRTIEPSEEASLRLLLWSYFKRRDLRGDFHHGHEYSLRLRRDVGLRLVRWTYGRERQLKGPFNMPSLDVRSETDVRFRFEEDVEIEPHSALHPIDTVLDP